MQTSDDQDLIEAYTKVIITTLKQLKPDPGNELLLTRTKRILIDLNNALAEIKDCKPYRVCPDCMGGGDCTHCGERGWITKSEYECLGGGMQDVANAETKRLSSGGGK